jgi:hypothetical protein
MIQELCRTVRYKPQESHRAIGSLILWLRPNVFPPLYLLSAVPRDIVYDNLFGNELHVITPFYFFAALRWS